MSSLTSGAPKEMLSLAGRPIIHHVVQEAIDAGIVEICIVIHKSKQVIRRYFESNNPEACEAGRPAEKLRSRCNIVFAYQGEPRGLGDAVLCAKAFVGDERFALLIPDQLFIGRPGAILQLTSKKLPANAVVSSLIRIPASELEYFPGARGFVCDSDAAQSGVMTVTGIEPAEQASSAPALRGFGRTIYPIENLPRTLSRCPQLRGAPGRGGIRSRNCGWVPLFSWTICGLEQLNDQNEQYPAVCRERKFRSRT
jgi:UTP--glucose-1-phosphate uridylyltransferase